jgi:hypothetical protein
MENINKQLEYLLKDALNDGDVNAYFTLKAFQKTL